MSEFDETRKDTLELGADQFENLGEVLRQTNEKNDAVYAEEIRVRTTNEAYLITANGSHVVLREETTGEE